LIAACHDVVALAPPEPANAYASMLLFAGEHVWAADSGGALPSLRFRASEPIVLHAIFYDRPLAELGLPPGKQKIVDEGPAIPSPDQILTATLGEGPFEWTALASLPAELASIRLETTLACAKWAVAPIDLEGVPGSGGRVLAPLGGERWLFASVAGRFFLVTRQGATAIDTPTTTPHVGSFTDSSGTVWLLGDRGRVATYRLDSGFEDRGTTASRSGDGDTGDLAGSSALPPELFAVSRNGVIDRFDGTSWRTVVGDPLPDHDSPGVAFLEPESAIAIGPRNGSAIVYDHGRISEEIVDDGLNAIAHIDGLGTVIGTVRGRYWLRNGSSWTPIPAPPSSTVVRALAPFRGGFVAGTINGLVTQYHPQLGFCEAEQLGSNGITRIVPTETGFVLTAIHELPMGDQPDVVTFVDAR
jgi:hypothetical protein